MPAQSNDLLAHLLGAHHIIVPDRPQMFGLRHCRAPLQQTRRFCTRCPLSPSRTRPAQSNEFIPLSFWYDAILVYLKTYALQVVQGRLFGMVQGKANQWIHVLLPALLATLRTLGDAPARSLTALAQRLGVTEAAAAAVVTPLAEEP